MSTPYIDSLRSQKNPLEAVKLWEVKAVSALAKEMGIENPVVYFGRDVSALKRWVEENLPNALTVTEEWDEGVSKTSVPPIPDTDEEPRIDSAWSEAVEKIIANLGGILTPARVILKFMVSRVSPDEIAAAFKASSAVFLAFTGKSLLDEIQSGEKSRLTMPEVIDAAKKATIVFGVMIFLSFLDSEGEPSETEASAKRPLV